MSLSSNPNSITAAGSIKLTATASDEVGVTKVEFYEGTTKLGEDTSAPYEQNIDFIFGNNGTKVYIARAFDAASNSASSKPVAVEVNIPPPADKTPPSVSLLSSSDNVVLPGSIKLTATATDDVSVSKVEFYDGTTKLGEDSSVPFEQNVDLARANNGTKSYSAKAFDAANNSASSAAVAVTVNIPEILPPTGTPASKGDLTASIGGLASRTQSIPTTTNQQLTSLNDDLNLAAIKIQAPTVVVQALSQIAETTANLAKNAFDPVAMMKEISNMAANAQSMASTSRLTKANTITKLPVGNYDCTGTINPCSSTTNANGDMIVTWKTKLNKTAIATIDWDALSAGTASAPILITTSEYSGNTYQSEVPTKLVAKVTVDNIIVANLQFEATWENSLYQYNGNSSYNNWRFSFKHLAVSGSLFSIDGATKLVDVAKLNYDYNPTTGIKTSGDISIKLGDLYRAKWDINLGGIEVTPGLSTETVIGIPGLAPFVPGNKNFKPQGALSLLVSLEIGSSLYVIDTKATGWTYQTQPYGSTTIETPKSLDGITGSAAFDGKLVTFAGKLDGADTNKNCLPFENLNMTFSDGTVTLEQFLIDRFPSIFKPGNCP